METEVAQKCDNSYELEVVTNLIELLQGPSRKLRGTRMRFWVPRGCLTSENLATDVVSHMAQTLYSRPVPDSDLTHLVKDIVEHVSSSRSHENQLFLTAVIFEEAGRYACEISSQEIGAFDELINLAATLIFANPRLRGVGRGKLEEPVCCSICLQNMSAGSYAARLPCLHVFHCNCVVKWLRKHNTCPLCRFEV